ncbi:hypothetical protein BMONG18_0716 [Bifidobacterium mongoliense]|uniref:Uncharacterized protein n=1 Tax=Bifidobacterium mongoliense TaxID=518643 RepID=A0A423UEK2_9BIFI|nr:hypothetical protein BMONG18_0716 [Bifidobacterium mongoliense]
MKRPTGLEGSVGLFILGSCKGLSALRHKCGDLRPEMVGRLGQTGRF